MPPLIPRIGLVLGLKRVYRENPDIYKGKT
jgi:hypothetical protein